MGKVPKGLLEAHPDILGPRMFLRVLIKGPHKEDEDD